ncbi:MAG: PepSY domain-containing protein [Nitrososphaerota archaeon]
MDRSVLMSVALATVIVGAAVGAIILYELWARGPPTNYTAVGSVASPNYDQGPWMMGGCSCQGWVGGQAPAPRGTRITIEQARDLVENYVSSRIGQGFKIHEIMEFENNFYAIVIESDSNVGAFELIVDPYTGVVSAEPGPNMMWNRKYGMHYAMMGWSTEPSIDMPMGPEDAVELARRYLAQRFGEEVVVLEPMRFYGYYTLDYMIGGEVHGMLSVNGYTGDIWYHSWHGGFIKELELEGEEH